MLISLENVILETETNDKNIIQECIEIALKTGEDEINVFIELMNEKGYKTNYPEIQTFIF